MSNYHNPKNPTEEQLAAMRDRFEVCGAGLVVKQKYHRSPAVGEPVGCINSRGYFKVQVLGRQFQAHHISWFLTLGEWPEQPLDHKDGNRINNSPDNLRLSSHRDNTQAHQKTRGAVGYRGVSFHKTSGKYVAQIRTKGKVVYLGLYDTPEESAIARDLFAYGEARFSWEGLNEIGQEYILKHHPDWIKDDD